MLAEALCKLEGFTYAPSHTIYWQHGHPTERDFIYVTTAHLSHDQLQQLSDEVGPDRTLLVLWTAFRAKPERFANLTVKKMPGNIQPIGAGKSLARMIAPQNYDAAIQEHRATVSPSPLLPVSASLF